MRGLFCALPIKLRQLPSTNHSESDRNGQNHQEIDQETNPEESRLLSEGEVDQEKRHGRQLMKKLNFTRIESDTVQDIREILDRQSHITSDVARTYMSFLLRKLDEAQDSIRDLLAEGVKAFDGSIEAHQNKNEKIKNLERRLFELTDGKEGRGPAK